MPSARWTNVDRAVDELTAAGGDVITYCDMVTTFIMEPGWNEAKVAEIVKPYGTPAFSVWTALHVWRVNLANSRKQTALTARNILAVYLQGTDGLIVASPSR